MAVRIRVYPQNGMLGMNGMGMNGGAVSAQTFFNDKLQSQKQVSNLQLGYERALWGERLDKVRLEERLKNPYAAMGTGIAGAYGGLPMGMPLGGVPMGLPMGLPMGGVPMGGMPLNTGMMGGIPAGFGGSGQTNITNQTSTGGNQTVSNVNTNNVSHRMVPQHFGAGGWGAPQFGGGGFLSSLLGALI